MKILKYVLICIGIFILLAVLGVFIFINTFDLNKYITPITAQASNVLGRKVSVGHADLHLDLFKGVDLQVQNVVIADDQAYGTAPFFTLGKFSASLDTIALLTRKEILLTSIQISDMYVRIIKDEKGAINAQTITVQPATKETTGNVSTTTSNVTPIPALPVLIVKSITLEKSTVIFDDQNKAFPLHVPLEHISITVDRFSLTDGFPIKVNAAFLSDVPNIIINANMKIDLAQMSVRTNDLDLSADLSSLILSRVKTISSTFAKMPMPESLKGSLNITVEPFTASSKGLDHLNAKADLNDLAFTFSDMPVHVRKVTIDTALDLSRPAINGVFNADLNEGVLQRFSLTQTVLAKLTLIPVLGPMMAEVLHNGSGQVTTQDDKTVIHSATLRTTLREGNMEVRTLNVNASPLNVDGHGKIDLSRMSVDLSLDARLSAVESQKLINSAKPLQGLLNDSMEIIIPGKLYGIVPHISYAPELSLITKKIATSQTSDQLGAQLDKVIQKNPEVGGLLNAVFGGTSSKDHGTTQSSDDPKSEGRSSEQLIKGLLNKVLK